MKKNNLYARIHYEPSEDSFQLQICSDADKEWGIVVSCQCKRDAEQHEAADTEFVHFSILKEIRRCIDLGYKFVN